MLRFLVLLLTICFGGLHAENVKTSPAMKVWSNESGEHFAYDGVFYSYANDTGQTIKLWVPPGDNPVRGMILHGNPGGGFSGDTRMKTRQRDLLEYGARVRFGVAGVSGFSGRSTYDELGRHVLSALEGWASVGDHPELAHLPFICSGGSNAGVFSFSMARFVPDRVIAITPNCGPVYVGEIPDDVLDVPAWMHVGTIDGLIPQGYENTQDLFAEHVPHGGVWAWEAEIKNHENGSSDHIDVAYWDAVIPLRLPDSVTPGEPVALQKLDPANGWWVDQRSWDHVITKVGPMSESKPHENEGGRYGWVPNEDIARIYQAAASRQRPLQLRFEDERDWEGGDHSGVYLSSGGSRIGQPGERVTVRVSYGELNRIGDEIEFYNQSRKLGSIDMSETDAFTFELDGDERVYSIYALGKTRSWGDRPASPRISNPLQIIVSDPELSGQIDAQLASTTLAAVFQSRAQANQLTDDAGALSPANEVPERTLELLPAASSSSADLDDWAPANASWLELGESATSALSVRMAGTHGESGLSLFVEVTDPSLADASQPGDVLSSDTPAGVFEIYLASIGLDRVIGAEATPEIFSQPFAYQLLRQGLQFRFHLLPDDQGAIPLQINHWEPWDWNVFETSSLDSFGGLGLKIARRRFSDQKLRLKIFVPWALVGNPGLPEAPGAGTSVSFAANYTTLDGEGRMRWPVDAPGPWKRPAVPEAEGEKVPPAYGQLLLQTTE